MTASVPTGGFTTAADLSYEPDDGLRRELHDGVVHVVPPPSDDHQWVATALHLTLLKNAPDDVYVLQGCGVHTGIRRMYVPDVLVVYRDAVFHDNAYDPGGVLLAVEIVSPSSVTMDRVAKPVVYGQSGIPFYWRVEPGPTVFCYRLAAATDAYEPIAEATAGQTLTLTEPWPVTLEVAELVMPHKR